jgi:hypothetical protein
MTAPFERADVEAPAGVYGWSVGRGWITSREDLLAAHDAGDDLIYVVPADGLVRDVVGQASIASLMRVDVRLLALRRELDELREGLLDVGETFVTMVAARPGDGS